MKTIFFTSLISFSFLPCFAQKADSTSTDTCNINVPNTISPNDDGLSDQWCITSNCPLKDFELWLFDRWGNIIWHTKDVTECWDAAKKEGKNKTAVEEGVYVWKLTCLKLINSKDEKKTYTGHVSLVK
jgi:gliding motility-associated-like protein